jgi:hypothetical protein
MVGDASLFYEVGTRLNPFDTAANGVLSENDAYLTFTSSSGRASVRSRATIILLQKCYFEVYINSLASSIAVGVANVLQSLTVVPGLTPSNASTVRQDGIFVNQDSANSGATAFTPAAVAGDTICVAYDMANSPHISFRLNNGFWNNSATGDPAASTDVFDAVMQNIGLGHTGVSYAIVSVAGPGDSVTVRFNSARWLFTPPSGFPALLDHT